MRLSPSCIFFVLTVAPIPVYWSRVRVKGKGCFDMLTCRKFNCKRACFPPAVLKAAIGSYPVKYVERHGDSRRCLLNPVAIRNNQIGCGHV